MSKFSEAAAEVDKRIAEKRDRLLAMLEHPLFDDPEMRPYVTAFTTAFHNGNGARGAHKPANPRTKKLGDVKAIREAMRGLPFPDPNHVTVSVVLSEFESNGFKVSMKDAPRTIREALYDNPDFEVVSQGQAGQASVYKRIFKTERAA